MGEKEISMESSARFFADVATEYTTGLKDCVDRKIEVDLVWLNKMLLSLYLAAFELPGLESLDVEETQPFVVQKVEMERKDVLLAFDTYKAIFNSHDRVEDAVLMSLSDDLVDVYENLSVGLELYREGFYEEALWNWRFLFQCHWGRHVLNAIKSIHLWIYE